MLCLGGGQATPLRPGRHLHILEDGEDAEEEANEAAEPEDNGQLDEEAPMHQVDEADSNDYGLNPEQLWHLQPEHWRGAVINSAPPRPVIQHRTSRSFGMPNDKALDAPCAFLLFCLKWRETTVQPHGLDYVICMMVCCAGARHEADDVLLLRIRWPDGFNSWVNRFALHVRPHCHMALIDFYESKAKPKK